MPRKPKAPEPPPKPPRRRRGTGSISIGADGTVRARLPERIDPKRTAKEFPPGCVAEAVAWLDGHLNPRPPEPAQPAVTTLGDWGGHWWETYVEPINPPNTAKWYRYALRQMDAAELDPPLTDRDIRDVRASQLQAAIGALSKRVDAATVQGVVGVWRRCLDAAVDDELIARNPAKKLVLPKAPRRPAARYVTADEVAELWPAIRGRRFEGGYALMLGCGLRIGEILGLHWKHVDFERKRIWVQWQFTNGHWRDLPKGSNPHWVPMPEDVELALRRHRLRQSPDAVLVMQSTYGRRRKRDRKDGKPWPWSRSQVAVDLQEIVAELGLDDLTPHAGRHGLATHLMANGVSPAVIAERLGNTAGVILSTYGHATDDGRSVADSLVDGYIGGHTEDDPGTETEASGRLLGDQAGLSRGRVVSDT